MEKKPASIEKIIDRNMKSVRHAQLIATYLGVYDVIAVTVAYFVALWLRFDLQFSAIQGAYFKVWLIGAPIYAVICLLVFRYFKMYRSMWRFASYTELQRAIYANAVTIVVQVVLMAAIFYFVFPDLALKRMPLSYYFMGAVFQFILTAGIRFSYRFLLLIRNKKSKEDPINALVIGAGAAATIVIRELKQKSFINEKIVGIIDDNPNKWHRDIDGIPIIGGRKMIPEAVKNLDVTKIYMAIPSVSATERKAIIDICKETGCELMTLPGMYQLMLGNVTVNSLRKVEVEDLLGRDPVKMNSRETRSFLS
ncbi:MAG: polysaccharide biosynthesis protein, partial [Firmicutes bacterium]|nr:polysaccharide biosynthesis protein [Bacillota bacterium]